MFRTGSEVQIATYALRPTALNRCVRLLLKASLQFLHRVLNLNKILHNLHYRLLSLKLSKLKRHQVYSREVALITASCQEAFT